MQLFIQVDSVGGYADRVELVGGRTIMPPQTLPDGGVLAIMHDPLGIPFGLMSRRPKA